MADEPIPVAETPPVAPATPDAPAPASSAGVSFSAPEPSVPEVVSDVPAIVEPEAPKPEPSLLATATQVEDATKSEEKVVSPAEAETSPAEAPIAYEPFTFPEGVTADEGALAKYTETLAANKIPQEAAQQFLDLHVAELQRLQTAMATQQQEVFNETRREWVNEVKAELGARFDTTLREAAFGRDAVMLNPAFGGSPELLSKFNELVDFTGVGDNVTFIRAFAAIGRALAEPPAPRGEPRPTPDRGVAGRGRATTRYPNMPIQNGAG